MQAAVGEVVRVDGADAARALEARVQRLAASRPAAAAAAAAAGPPTGEWVLVLDASDWKVRGGWRRRRRAMYGVVCVDEIQSVKSFLPQCDAHARWPRPSTLMAVVGRTLDQRHCAPFVLSGF